MSAAESPIPAVRSRGRKPAALAAIAAAAYSALAAVYIGLSGHLAAIRAADIPELERLEFVKGLAFVLFNGLIFFLSVWLLLRQIVSNRLELQGHREKLISIENQARIDAQAAGAEIRTLNCQLQRQLDERENLIAQLESKNGELERFTSTVSHDLKAPLVTIRGFASLAEQDARTAATETLRHDLAQIASAAEMMEKLLNDLLELSRIGRTIQAADDVGLTQIAEEAAGLCASAALQRGVSIQIDAGMPVVRCDTTRLREVFQNLIDNAIKFSATGREPFVRVSAAVDKGRVTCCVVDNGIGLDQQNCERIFEVFEQTNPGAGGNGLGLAIAKRIVEVHGGRVWVESDGPGTGCRFYFTLPAKG